MSQPADTQIAIDNLHVADAVTDAGSPPASASATAVPPSTLGQTPHEPTVRPWEQELLISGALVFSLIQLPGQLDAWFNGVRPTLDAGWFMAAFLGWFYVKMALYALVGGFVLHLCVRGYWVGVIGLEAVFPEGIRWDRMRTGPIMREMQRQRTPSLQTLIDRADRLASMIFGGAFAIALMFVYSVVYGAVLVVGTVVLSRWVIADRDKAMMVMEGLFFLFLAPMMVAGMVDRRMGDRLDPNGRAARIIRRIGVAGTRFVSSMIAMPLLYTLLTNLRQRRHGSVLMLVMFSFSALVLVKDVMIPRGVIRTDGYTYLPNGSRALSVLPAFYADQREGSAEDAKLPEIQSDMVRDPYVRLFIPYLPRRHNQLIERRCPGAARTAPDNDAATEAVLRCMAALQPVTLNGKPVESAWRFYTQPETGLRGIVAYIPTAGLPRGENQLGVAALPQLDATAKPDPPYRIPFWL